jgi:hypothetical protein
MNYNVTCIIVTFVMRIFYFSLHKHNDAQDEEEFGFLGFRVGPSRRFIWIPPPHPAQCKVTQNGLFDNWKITMKISLSLSLSLSISQWKNSKNETLKYQSHNSLAELSVYVLFIQLQFLTGFHSFPLYTEHPKQVSCIPHHLISHYISGAHWRVSSLFLFLFFFLLAY